jgi:predicted transcriptional regulator
MKKTSVYLEPELDRALDLLAEQRGISKAEAIRAALRRAVADVKRPPIRAIGVGRGPGDVVDNFDEYLKGFGER